jgi:hypothetical protein
LKTKSSTAPTIRQNEGIEICEMKIKQSKLITVRIKGIITTAFLLLLIKYFIE